MIRGLDDEGARLLAAMRRAGFNLRRIAAADYWWMLAEHIHWFHPPRRNPSRPL